ncbi:MAG: hypothetical protein XD69_0500 [Clostridia bacterium 62_21]|nr:MAG: hypothetical protein XD69_0500 [Clostridia bacterium 62_21]HAG07330.1 hypothetical protein [Peptococcaceae bacterium]
MANRPALFREMLETTRKILAIVQGIPSPEPGNTEEYEAGLRALADLLASREKVAKALDGLGPAVAPREREEIRSLLGQIRKLDVQIADALEAHQKDLAGLLRQVREGKKALTYLRVPGPGTGVVFDYKK